MRLEVLGWIIDSDRLTLSLPPSKSVKLQRLLEMWPPDRTTATRKQTSKLTFVLPHVSIVVRSGIFFVQRLLAQAGMLRSGVSSSDQFSLSGI